MERRQAQKPDRSRLKSEEWNSDGSECRCWLRFAAALAGKYQSRVCHYHIGVAGVDHSCGAKNMDRMSLGTATAVTLEAAMAVSQFTGLDRPV